MLPKTYLYSYNLTLLLLNSKELQAVTKISASTIIISQTRIFHPNCRALPNMSAITVFQMAAGSWTLLMYLEKNISVWHQLAAVPWVSSSSGCFTLDLCFFCRESVQQLISPTGAINDVSTKGRGQEREAGFNFPLTVHIRCQNWIW